MRTVGLLVFGGQWEEQNNIRYTHACRQCRSALLMLCGPWGGCHCRSPHSHLPKGHLDSL